MKPSSKKNKNLIFPYFLLFLQPVFMASNLIVARGGVEFVPPVSLAFWRWTTVFILLVPFFYKPILKKIKIFKKDNENTLEKRVLKVENQIYTKAIKKFIYTNL